VRGKVIASYFQQKFTEFFLGAGNCEGLGDPEVLNKLPYPGRASSIGTGKQQRQSLCTADPGAIDRG
jgi:hypothetical protein